jgi:iron complex outermembrane receptor protein
MRRRILALKIGALAALASIPVAAQENARFTLEEVVVTAQKRTESSQDVPISIQVFSADGIEKLGATELFDLAKGAPHPPTSRCWAWRAW